MGRGRGIDGGWVYRDSVIFRQNDASRGRRREVGFGAGSGHRRGWVMPGMVYIGFQLLSAKSCRRGRRREVEFGAASKIWRKVTEILYKTCEDRTRQTRTNFTSRTSMCWCWCWWCWCCCCCRRQKGKPASYAGCELCGCEPALPAFSTDAHPLQCVCAVSCFFCSCDLSSFNTFAQFFV